MNPMAAVRRMLDAWCCCCMCACSCSCACVIGAHSICPHNNTSLHRRRWLHLGLFGGYGNRGFCVGKLFFRGVDILIATLFPLYVIRAEYTGLDAQGTPMRETPLRVLQFPGDGRYS
ncbi:hypothetical protein EX30DRAFT_113901 [Ascodesmis nigricans]|uniref:Secreted protein n=1 Tax=Ascodesmis nigricans TaxID=341454 RepID=A0A4S2MPU7_9PEZI|nr:hypothetical protein EX30DRAFT_113901 [Ascodesmis nigricans]